MEVKLIYVVKVCFFKYVERQQQKSVNRRGIEEKGGVSSPASMTRSKQGLVEGIVNIYNVSKIIENKCIGGGGGVGNRSNASKTIDNLFLQKAGRSHSNVLMSIEKQALERSGRLKNYFPYSSLFPCYIQTQQVIYYHRTLGHTVVPPIPLVEQNNLSFEYS